MLIRDARESLPENCTSPVPHTEGAARRLSIRTEATCGGGQFGWAAAVAEAAGTSRVRTLLARLAMLVIIGSMASALIVCGYASPPALARAAWVPLMTAGLLCLGYGVANAIGWVLILRCLGYRPALSDGIRTWLGSEAFRWLPGSVWNFGARTVEAARLGVPVAVTVATIAVELLLSVTSRILIVAVACLSYASTSHPLIVVLPWRPLLALFLALVVMGGLGLLLLKGTVVIRRLQQRMRSVQRAIGEVRLRGRDATLLLMYHLMIRIFHGAALWCVVRSIADTAIPIGIVVAANALAWLMGFFAVFAPGGLVVREVVLATILSGWLSTPQALAIAVGWRILQIVSEGALVTCVWLPSRPAHLLKWRTTA